MLKENNKFLVDSPSGWRGFSGIQKINKDSLLDIYFNNDKCVSVTLDHKLVGEKDKIVISKDLKIGDLIKTRYGFVEVENIEIKYGDFFVYDLLNVEGKNLYYTNDVISHNCGFLGSTNTLISGKKLRELTHVTPIYSEINFDVYKYPEAKHVYSICVDVSRGQGLDYSAFTVVDITEFPYRLVAKYRSNEISPLIFPDIINRVATKYNYASVLVEINDIGQQVADTLKYDLEYENVLVTKTQGRKGQQISGGYSKNISLGLRQTTSTKKIGCSTLKDLVEQNKLIIEDFDIISELSTFVANKDSFAADDDKHDDLAMCLVMFSWLVNQRYFKDSMNDDLRQNIYRDQMRFIEEQMVPFGVIVDGVEDKDYVVEDDGTVWQMMV